MVTSFRCHARTIATALCHGEVDSERAQGRQPPLEAVTPPIVRSMKERNRRPLHVSGYTFPYTTSLNLSQPSTHTLGSITVARQSNSRQAFSPRAHYPGDCAGRE